MTLHFLGKSPKNTEGIAIETVGPRYSQGHWHRLSDRWSLLRGFRLEVADNRLRAFILEQAWEDKTSSPSSIRFMMDRDSRELADWGRRSEDAIYFPHRCKGRVSSTWDVQLEDDFVWETMIPVAMEFITKQLALGANRPGETHDFYDLVWFGAYPSLRDTMKATGKGPDQVPRILDSVLTALDLAAAAERSGLHGSRTLRMLGHSLDDDSGSLSLLRWSWATAFREILPLDHRQSILAWTPSKLQHWGSYWPKSVYSDTSFWNWLAHRSGPRTILTLLEEFLFDSNDENHRFFFDLEIFFQTLVEHGAPFTPPRKNSLKAWHDTLLIQTDPWEKNRPVPLVFSYEDQWHPVNNLLIGRLRLRLPVDSLELYLAGRLLENCVATYSSRVSQRQTTVILVDLDSELYACVEIIEGRIEQLLGQRNRRLPVEHQSLILKSLAPWLLSE